MTPNLLTTSASVLRTLRTAMPWRWDRSRITCGGSQQLGPRVGRGRPSAPLGWQLQPLHTFHMADYGDAGASPATNPTHAGANESQTLPTGGAWDRAYRTPHTPNLPGQP